ncbi:GNAT family N-acetyltransferase [Veronia pacifica]|uniref:Acetyltransferase n=2 Tax=Veronia pacifica TaxID=1080227 RepID=A0A1C3EDL3_9GAMM|nr:GNAT family N-acetyltransferase [Veronia pacifica]ODA31294.1 acetyltransferase [Veronia pacifica]
MQFVPVDLSRHLSLCLGFRKDAYQLSFGHTEGFDEDITKNWYQAISTHPDVGFYLVMNKGECIGQVEFRNALEDHEGVLFGHINLLYLIPEYRHKGLGEQLQQYALNAFKARGCKKATLRFYWNNTGGKKFYQKHGWRPVGHEGPKGQLMELFLDTWPS